MERLEVVEITTADSEWLARAESVHRQLRPGLPSDYAERLREIFANGGRLSVVAEDGAVRALALWRLIENTYEGRRLYVDDLVTDEARRSQGFAERLFGCLQEKARQLGCDVIALDSGVQRAGAHRFYFREGMHISSFCFKKADEGRAGRLWRDAGGQGGSDLPVNWRIAINRQFDGAFSIFSNSLNFNFYTMYRIAGLIMTGCLMRRRLSRS